MTAPGPRPDKAASPLGLSTGIAIGTGTGVAIGAAWDKKHQSTD